jgi:putative MFS transporter
MEGDSARDLGTKIDSLKRIPLGAGVLLAISFSSFFTYYDITNYAYIAPVLKTTWGVGDDQIATGASMTVLGYVIGAFSLTIFADSYGRRPAFLISILILGAGSFLAASSQDMTQMNVFRLLTGIGIGSEIAITGTYIGELSPKSKRGRYTSIVVMLGWAGLAASGPVSLALIQADPAAGIEGWRLVMAIPGVAALISLFLRLRMPESPRWLLSKGRIAEANSVLASVNIAPVEKYEPQPAKSSMQFFRNRTVASRAVLLAAVWFLVFVPVYASLLLVVEYVNQGYSLTESISINIISSIGFVVGALLSIPIAERIERKYQISAAGSIMAAAFILRGLLVNDFAGLVIAGFVAFAANAWLATSLYTYTAESFPTKMRSSGSGIVEGSGRALSALGPLVFVLLQPYGFMNLMIGISLFSFAAAAAVLCGPRTRGQSLEALNKES